MLKIRFFLARTTVLILLENFGEVVINHFKWKWVKIEFFDINAV